MSALHSPTPWSADPSTHSYKISDANQAVIAEIFNACADLDAERVVACVNACDEIPDPSKLPELVAFLQQATSYLADESGALVAQDALRLLGVSS